MVLSLFRFMASHPPFLAAAVVIYVLSIRECLNQAEICEIKANETIPDSRFGYSSQQLNNLYEAWGADGRKAYIKTANTELFPFMESYALIMGSLLIIAARRMNWKEEIAFLAIFTMLCDAGETLVQRRGSQVYPEQLSATTIAAGSLFCQVKWLLVGLSALLVSVSVVMGKPRHKKSRRANKTTKSAALGRKDVAVVLPQGLTLLAE